MREKPTVSFISSLLSQHLNPLFFFFYLSSSYSLLGHSLDRLSHLESFFLRILEKINMFWEFSFMFKYHLLEKPFFDGAFWVFLKKWIFYFLNNTLFKHHSYKKHVHSWVTVIECSPLSRSLLVLRLSHPKPSPFDLSKASRLECMVFSFPRIPHSLPNGLKRASVLVPSLSLCP